jgi:hypothetical protein
MQGCSYRREIPLRNSFALYFHLILQLLLLNFHLTPTPLLKEKECNILKYSSIAPLLKERGWGEVKRKNERAWGEVKRKKGCLRN